MRLAPSLCGTIKKKGREESFVALEGEKESNASGSDKKDGIVVKAERNVGIVAEDMYHFWWRSITCQRMRETHFNACAGIYAFLLIDHY